MNISILTLFPEMFQGPFDYSIIKNAKVQKKVDIEFINIRDFGIGKHKVVDDKPYGGGIGMILRVDVLEKAISETKDLPAISSRRRQAQAGKRPASPAQTRRGWPRGELTTKDQRVILLSPHGKTFNQKKALELSRLKHLILVCGRYEGIDERAKEFIDEELSIGDFVVTGGEIPAMLVVDAVVRLIDGVLKKGVTTSESFSPILEYPQYTKPNAFKNLDVPPILLSGDHKKIKDWRDNEALIITNKLRPDLLSRKKS
ncbi:MAG: tRNA (guanosine(37)-N1)-methyltransferase TrmD [Candidatus Levybacteria bacterium]|nr:tRNA (guanosine(37)-N1)-methyltransferase TrmD [Candidatus Levybacteria bacterium]